MAKLIELLFLLTGLAEHVLCFPSSVPLAFRALSQAKASSMATTTYTYTTTTTLISYKTLTYCSTASTPTGSHPASTSGQPNSAPARTSSPSSSFTPVVPTTPTVASPSDGVDPNEPSFDGCYWNVPGVGAFAVKKEYTFFENALPDGLYVSDYTVYDSYDNDNTQWNHKFTPNNVFSDGDFLNLVVTGTTKKPSQSPDSAVLCGEVETVEQNILYGSVRVNAIFSDVPGTCHGFFYYKDDTQESDIEYLTDPNSKGNNVNQTSSDGDPIPLWYSNQSLRPPAPATQQIGPPPWDVTAVHEYRLDWTKDFTAFYVDGVLQKRFITNIPNKPCHFMINNWSNGDIYWSAGPPTQDNTLKIQNITMYYNTTNSAQAC